MEIAEALLGPTLGHFSTTGDLASFSLETPGEREPVPTVLGFIENASVEALIPFGSKFDLSTWKVGSAQSPDLRFPQPKPPAPASLPAVLRLREDSFCLDSWGDATRRDNVKFWAGSGGYPGAALVRDALELVRGRLDESVLLDPFGFSAAQSSSLRFDWRRDYVPLGIGFSLNEHPKIDPRGFPLVEILAVAGLAHARPARPEPRNKLKYRYGVLWGEAVPILFHRAALGCAELPFNTRYFSILLDWPGQENQARCITSVTEEPIP
jgi:CRISPR-associated protein Csx14